jgi:hypothetical protein
MKTRMSSETLVTAPSGLRSCSTASSLRPSTASLVGQRLLAHTNRHVSLVKNFIHGFAAPQKPREPHYQTIKMAWL